MGGDRPHYNPSITFQVLTSQELRLKGCAPSVETHPYLQSAGYPQILENISILTNVKR